MEIQEFLKEWYSKNLNTYVRVELPDAIILADGFHFEYYDFRDGINFLCKGITIAFVDVKDIISLQ